MVSIVVKITVKENAVAVVREQMMNLVAETVKEDGCVEYRLHQDNDNSAVFFFYETWSNQEALQQHLESAHIRTYRTATSGLITDYSLHKLTRLV